MVVVVERKASKIFFLRCDSSSVEENKETDIITVVLFVRFQFLSLIQKATHFC